MKILTEFKNRKVAHQELFEGRVIIITESKANGYSTFICNKRFDILSDDTHSTGSENIELSVSWAKTTISHFL